MYVEENNLEDTHGVAEMVPSSPLPDNNDNITVNSNFSPPSNSTAFLPKFPTPKNDQSTDTSKFSWESDTSAGPLGVDDTSSDTSIPNEDEARSFQTPASLKPPVSPMSPQRRPNPARRHLFDEDESLLLDSSPTLSNNCRSPTLEESTVTQSGLKRPRSPTPPTPPAAPSAPSAPSLKVRFRAPKAGETWSVLENVSCKII